MTKVLGARFICDYCGKQEEAIGDPHGDTGPAKALPKGWTSRRYHIRYQGEYEIDLNPHFCSERHKKAWIKDLETRCENAD